ncbi:facilitated trehalose transporter Tret1-like [Culex pipiens pallens]|uniref:facilitated trehalose transporter Tret1-like n=1 Tax=Culex pipiens pallens TaxID=42434 RepID=UPI0022AA867D|nr:facilitated trehalose transporter Tret1-like [Culex pipiens pallens]
MSIVKLLQTHRNEFVASLAATLCLFMVITTNAWTSPALPKLLADDSPVPITEDEGSWIVAILAIGGLCGPIVAGVTVDRIGRKFTLLATFVPVVIGWTLVGLGDAVGYLYASRFLFGLSYGTAYSVSPIYLGEIASDQIRGTAGTFITVMAKLGYMAVGHPAVYCIGPYVEYYTYAWISMAAPAIFVLCFFWMPESPHYLIEKQKDAEAAKSLRWLRRRSSVSEEINAIRTSIQQASANRGSFRELFDPQYRNNIRIVLVLVFAMQFTALLPILSYAQTIFEKISIELKPEEMSIVLGAVQFLAVLFPAVLVDRVGRRPLLLISTAGASLGLLAAAAYFAVETADNIDTTSLGWLAFVALLLFIVFYGLGLATVSFAVLSEIFPVNIRAFANALFTILSALVLFVMVKMFQLTLDNVGPYLPFGMFGVFGLIGGALIYAYIPETKGRSLDEVQRIVSGKRVD